MDGGGRHAGSLRQPGAESVRSGLTGLFRRKPAPPRVRGEHDNHFIAKLEDRLPRNFGTMATLLILLGSLAVGVVRGGHLEFMIEAFRDARDAVANTAGFRIAHVAITGRKNLSQDEVLAIGGVTGRRSLLFLDAADVRDRLKAAPWIADATVLKFYPDSIQIDIVERTALRAVAARRQRVGDFRQGHGAAALHAGPVPLAAARGRQGRRDPREGFPRSPCAASAHPPAGEGRRLCR